MIQYPLPGIYKLHRNSDLTPRPPTSNKQTIQASHTKQPLFHTSRLFSPSQTSPTVASQASSSPGDEDTAESDYLPYPANKLIIGQYYYCSRESPCWWGWLIVGTFYDQDNNPVWSTQIFALQRDTRDDSDSEADSEESGESLFGKHRFTEDSLHDEKVLDFF
ncbi:hypothetical protein CPLU01_10847 [Colletotrichum plurivorum]|uniref:Uncharacterized protein n=1 Tax=Colletotrichum plurivorum TaxID=2175906 RepID=A0A8H6K4S9_9PEZI|nr:hypothetical protein CPLU01_10847 [Colletotrichum plurivorum]